MKDEKEPKIRLQEYNWGNFGHFVGYGPMIRTNQN
jgi:hypothetical protein